jgi:TetR/AcrR family transcriptional repressor of nem operon
VGHRVAFRNASTIATRACAAPVVILCLSYKGARAIRYDAQHKARSRELILKAAARQLRERGPGNVAVAEVMSAAGLTHGAFYAHFASKGALVAEAVETMFRDARHRTPGLADASTDDPGEARAALRAYLANYLSSGHRDRPERGCPLPALAADMARETGLARHSFSTGLTQLVGRLETALARIGREDPAAEARTVTAQIVGAVALARALGKGLEADAMLRDTLDMLVARLEL